MKAKFTLTAQAVIDIDPNLFPGKSAEEIIAEYIESFNEDIVAFITGFETNCTLLGEVESEENDKYGEGDPHDR